MDLKFGFSPLMFSSQHALLWAFTIIVFLHGAFCSLEVLLSFTSAASMAFEIFKLQLSSGALIVSERMVVGRAVSSVSSQCNAKMQSRNTESPHVNFPHDTYAYLVR